MLTAFNTLLTPFHFRKRTCHERGNAREFNLMEVREAGRSDSSPSTYVS